MKVSKKQMETEISFGVIFFIDKCILWPKVFGVLTSRGICQIEGVKRIKLVTPQTKEVVDTDLSR